MRLHDRALLLQRAARGLPEGEMRALVERELSVARRHLGQSQFDHQFDLCRVGRMIQKALEFLALATVKVQWDDMLAKLVDEALDGIGCDE